MKTKYYLSPTASVGVIVKRHNYCDGQLAELKKKHPKVFSQLLEKGIIIKNEVSSGESKEKTDTDSKEVVSEG